MKTKYLILILVTIGLSSCTVIEYQRSTSTHQATQLETREFQTRMFDTNNTKLIMKAMVNVLQDDNYIITNAVPDLGVIMAKKEIDLGKSKRGENIDNDFWIAFFDALNKKGQPKTQQERVFQKTKIVEVSINVTDYGRQSKVRANFQAKILDNKGDVVEVFPVQDGKFYQDFFAKVDKAIFLQKQGL